MITDRDQIKAIIEGKDEEQPEPPKPEGQE